MQTRYARTRASGPDMPGSVTVVPSCGDPAPAAPTPVLPHTCRSTPKTTPVDSGNAAPMSSELALMRRVVVSLLLVVGTGGVLDGANLVPTLVGGELCVWVGMRGNRAARMTMARLCLPLAPEEKLLPEHPRRPEMPWGTAVLAFARGAA
jgi:hypothetical protein